MADPKDPAIKLFGKTIPWRDISLTTAVDEENQERLFCLSSSSDEKDKKIDGEVEDVDDKDESRENPSDTKYEDCNPSVPSSDDNESPASKTSKTDEEQNETSTSQEKTTLKKPDKILPCPRCKSMDTKFCYYNNYNVNQPRHFCKNCQRYWTAGGTMRNVPVGAGRRKNKNSASHFRQIPLSEAVHNVSNGTVIAFSSDTPLPESMANDVHKTEMLKMPTHCAENGDNNRSSSMASNSKSEIDESRLQPQVPANFPWPYPWTLPFCPPGFPMPVYPAPPFWACPWNVPWPNPPMLGKHARDTEQEENLQDKNTEKCLWIPKTLRIDDPGEAAKSSIWMTLGINIDKSDSGGRGGLCKSFQSKGEENTCHTPESSSALHANPAALSRSQNFHEGL